MPDPIWLDTNTLIFALKGDPEINKQLSSYRQLGRQLLVTPKVRDEILNGNVLTENEAKGPVWKQRPFPEKAALTEQGMYAENWREARPGRAEGVERRSFELLRDTGEGCARNRFRSTCIVPGQGEREVAGHLDAADDH